MRKIWFNEKHIKEAPEFIVKGQTFYNGKDNLKVIGFESNQNTYSDDVIFELNGSTDVLDISLFCDFLDNNCFKLTPGSKQMILEKNYQEEKILEIFDIHSECKIPGTDVVLESGDKIGFVSTKEATSIADLKKLSQGLSDYFKKNKEYFDVYTLPTEGAICIDINRGDWKHDHLRADYLADQYFDSMNVDYMKSEKITDEGDSDCYSAIHYYHIM